MIDHYGRNINYLRISVTDLCNLRCLYCMPESGVRKKEHKEILRNEDIERLVKAAVEIGITKFRLTGGEPLVRNGIIDLVNSISKYTGVEDLGITTNGILLSKYADSLKKAGLNRVNISIDSLDAQKYERITRGGKLKDVLEGIKAAKEANLSPIKLNVVLIGGFNDDEIEEFVNLTVNEDMEVRFIELMPLGEASDWDKAHFLSNTEILKRIPSLKPLPFKGAGGIARYYKLDNSKGRVGLISPLSNHFCEYCNRIRITPDGKLKPCLHSNKELNIEDYRNKDKKSFFIDGIREKPFKHKVNDIDFVPVDRNMHEIGG